MARRGKVRVRLAPGVVRKIERSPGVTKARMQAAEAVADGTRDRMPVDDGDAIDSVRVEAGGPGPEGQDRVAVAEGNSSDAFHVIFPEFGGRGFRPPPAPMRSAAQAYGNYRDRGGR